ncbi:GNAT family N-acetyltransferase [Microbacterium sp. KSW2-29]|uniref:GNAT family N-acetyltransferase n=1 Tax=Microbacterium phycohabitans TaxID=3075993 RepID=A0ABU3SIC3_9MICO|nr:GNAT family N-acetyltransferase [Microbacterium sp. KSW2-29]MDU0344540.1 GNAT family N-acetyltransferase [Microbacterium sp. KSW2-29]
MSAEIREPTGEDDLDRVAAFFVRNGYGPPGDATTGAVLGRVFHERGVRLFLIAEERGEIVATIGYAAMSGRRVAPAGQLFAGMFVIAPSHRTGMLAGRLFTDSFDRLVASGVRGLRVEVDPANTRAFPLYVRVGFRALDGMTPDEDGYVELVSVLPGVTADLMNNAATWTGRSLGGGQRNWRSIRSSRAQSVNSGIVRRPKGVDAIRYEFELPGLFVSATGRVNDAALVALSVNDSPAPGFVPPDDNDGAHRTRVTRSRAVGDFTVAVDDRGALVVSHPAHLGPVVADPHPVAGASAAGPRRPLSRPVVVDMAVDSWRIDDGDVERVVEFLPSGVRVTATSRDASEVVSYPRLGLRVAHLTLLRDGTEVHSAHAVRGRWPVDRVDFEAAADATSSWPADGAEVVWSDGLSGITVAATRLRGRRIRLEGGHLVRLSGEGTAGYDLALTAAARSAFEWTESDCRVIDTWRRSRRALADVIRTTTDAGTLTVAPDAGLVEWTRDSLTVVSSPFPSRRSIGPLTTVSTALWVCAQPDRTDGDRGAVWPTDDARVPFQAGGECDEAGWSLVTFEGTTDLGLRVSARAEERKQEAVVFLMLAKVKRVAVADAAGGRVDLDVSPGPWRTWTREAGFQMDQGWLHLAPVCGASPEILIRSTPQGVLIAAYSRLSSKPTATVWRFRWEAS